MVSSPDTAHLNFATYIDTGNAKTPIAQRGKAQQKRSDLRLVGLGLVITRDGGIPDPHTGAGEVTVVFDTGHNSTANFAYLASCGLGYVGSVPPVTIPTCLPYPCPGAGPLMLTGSPA